MSSDSAVPCRNMRRHSSLQRLVEGAAVGDAGQGVDRGDALQLGRFLALAAMQLDELQVEPAVPAQQHDEHEARRREPVSPPGVKAEIDSARH